MICILHAALPLLILKYHINNCLGFRWDSAMLQNANTRCNGLLPLWGPQVAEAAFASCLAKHNAYLLEATRHRDIGYQSTIHDLKLLLLRFAQVLWIAAIHESEKWKCNFHPQLEIINLLQIKRFSVKQICRGQFLFGSACYCFTYSFV